MLFCVIFCYHFWLKEMCSILDVSQVSESTPDIKTTDVDHPGMFVKIVAQWLEIPLKNIDICKVANFSF